MTEKQFRRKLEDLMMEEIKRTTDSPWMQEIFRRRFVENFRYQEIAQYIGGGNTEDSVRALIRREIEYAERDGKI